MVADGVSLLERLGTLFSIVALTASSLVSSGQTPPTGSARLTGRVIAADDSRPVRRATVSLSGYPFSQPTDAAPVNVSRQLETDVNGRFDFSALPAGRYAISVGPTRGFLGKASYKEASVADGQKIDTTIRLERVGAIEGRIVDEYGDGILGAEVLAIRRQTNEYVAHANPRAATDDRGRFRLFNVPPGTYLVAATQQTRRFHDEPAPRDGYATTYYPGVTDRPAARAVVVRGGRDTQGVNFALKRTRLARVTIAAVDSRGVALGREAHASLSRRDRIDWSSSILARPRGDGQFVFEGVEPGDYHLIVTTSPSIEEGAYLNLSIDDDMSLAVRTNTGAKVSGRVIVDGQPANAGKGFRHLLVNSRPPSGTYGFKYSHEPSARLEGTDRFELAGLRGPMVLWAEVYLGALMSIRRNGEELTGKTLEFIGTETLEDVVVELTTKVADLHITVTGARDLDDSELVAVLFPEDSTQWNAGRVVQWDIPHRADGVARTVEMIRRLPGRYLIAAITTAGFRDPAEPNLLKTLRPLATPVTLVAGETANVTLAATRIASLTELKSPR